MKYLLKNKKAWLKILEAFIAIILISIVALMLITKNSPSNSDSSDKIYEIEKTILREIQLNDTWREEILSITSLPKEIDDDFQEISLRILQKTPNFLRCKLNVCTLTNDCILAISESQGKSVYVQSTIITSTSNLYAPRQIKIFCYRV